MQQSTNLFKYLHLYWTPVNVLRTTCSLFSWTVKEEAKTKAFKRSSPIILNICVIAVSICSAKWLAASQTLSIPPCSASPLHVDSAYLLICVAYELLWHAAEPPGSSGDMIELGDFGFLVTAVKLHSDDETAVQLCLQLTVGCWCLCGSLQGWGKFSLMKESANVRLLPGPISSHRKAIPTVWLSACMYVCVDLASEANKSTPFSYDPL